MRAGLFSLAAATASRAAKVSTSAAKNPSPKPSPSPSARRPSSKHAAAASSDTKSSSKPVLPSSKKAVASSAAKNPAAKTGNGTKTIYNLSPTLANLLNVSETTRHDALKRVWEYIKAQKLQNNLDRNEILCDDKLTGLFGQAKVTINEVVKLLSPHILKKE